MNTKELVLVANDEVALGTLLRQLEEPFQGCASLRGLTVATLPEDLRADLVLVSSPSIAERVARRTGCAERILVARRSLTSQAIETLSKIRQRSTCYVAMDYQLDAEATVTMLRELGVNWLRLIPVTIASLGPSLAVSGQGAGVLCFGKKVEAPPGCRVYDLGLRRIDFSTIVEAFARLQLPVGNLVRVASRWGSELVGVIGRLGMSMRSVSRVRQALEAVLASQADAVFVVDQAGRVAYRNPAAALLTEFKATPGDGGTFWDVFPGLTAPSNPGAPGGVTGPGPGVGTVVPEDGYERLVRMGDRQVMARVIPFAAEQGRPEWIVALKDVSEIQRLSADLSRHLRSSGYVAKYSWSDVIAVAPPMRAAVTVAQQAAKTDLPVLLLGETGTGKELFAHAIHATSARAAGPFVAINLSALPEQLAESELFGYERGAFTGAASTGKPGLFELANGGTIFLDEVADAAFTVQAKLLRVLQEKEVVRVGGRRIIPVDVRVVAATNSDLPGLVGAGGFRQDLFYRLAAIPISIPPLRRRKEDIPLLVKYFSDGQEPGGVVDEAELRRLTAYDWPGNVRELSNYVNYVVQMGCPVPWLDIRGTSAAEVAVSASGAAVTGSAIPAPGAAEGGRAATDFNGAASASASASASATASATASDAAADADKVIRRAILRSVDYLATTRGSAGRRTLLELVAEGAGVSSERRLRALLEMCREEGLIEIHHGRAGIRLTPKGRSYLSNGSVMGTHFGPIPH